MIWIYSKWLNSITGWDEWYLCCYIFEEPAPHKKGKNQYYYIYWKRFCFFFLYCRKGCQTNLIKWDDILSYQIVCSLSWFLQLFSSLFIATEEYNMIRLSEVVSAQHKLITLCRTKTWFLESLRSTYTTSTDTYKPQVTKRSGWGCFTYSTLKSSSLIWFSCILL